MADPERLLEGGTEFERALLRGGLGERPAADLTRRMALGVGVSGALTYTSTAKALMQSWWGKATAALVVGAGVAGVVATVSTRDAAPEAQSGEPATQAAPMVPAEHAAGEQSREDSPALVIEDLETDELDSEEGPAAQAQSRPRRTAQSSLAQEIKLLDRARALVRRGDRAGAAQVLKTYQQRYPDGVLRREARVLSARAQAPR